MYFIKIEGEHNSNQIVNKITDLDHYREDFQKIYAHLNKNGEYFYEFNEHQMKIKKNENIVKHGYLYNSKSTIVKVIYTISLIKINQVLSSLFPTNKVDQFVQVDLQQPTIEIEKTSSVTQTNQHRTHDQDVQTHNEFFRHANVYRHTYIYRRIIPSITTSATTITIYSKR